MSIMKKIIIYRYYLALGYIAVPFLSSVANAQNAVLAETPGLSALQAETATAIQAVCVELSGVYHEKITNNPQTARSDLFQQCNGMVRNGNQIQGIGSNTNSLGLNGAGLGSALQNVATEEIASQSRISNSTLSSQIAAIANHMNYIHHKAGGGAGDEQNFSINGLNLFVTGSGGFGDSKATTFENGMNFNDQRVLVGADYRFNDNFIAGLATGYTHINSDFISDLNVAGGSIEADIFNISMFGSYDIDNFFVDGILSYSRSSYDSERRVVVTDMNNSTAGADRVASASPDGNHYSANLGVGYRFNYDELKIIPFFRGRAMYGEIDQYSENGAYGLNLDVNQQHFDSVQSILGTQLSYSISQSYGVIIPQAVFSWNHEFQNNSRTISAHYSADPSQIALLAATDNPDRDFFILGGGISGVLQGGVQLFFNYQTLLGYQNINSHSFNSGIRYEF